MFTLVLIMIVGGALYYFTSNIILSVVLFLLLTFLYIWNSQFKIAKNKENVNQAKGNIEDAFQKRYNILSKIFESTKGYIQFKENELEVITGLLKSMDKPSYGYKERYKLQNQMKNILLNNMSSLRDNQTGEQFDTLNRSINEVEENLSASRRFYNFAINEYNTTIQSFPGFIMAKLKGDKVMGYFEVENEEVRNDIELKF